MLRSPFSTLYSSASVLHEALEARTDDRRIVVELLSVPVESVKDVSPSGQSPTRRVVCKSQNR